MIPILYESNEVSFSSNGMGRLRDILSCVVTEERNSGVYECDFEYPVDGGNFELIQPGRIIAVTHDESGDVQPFDIVSYSKPINGVVAFHAVHVSYRQTSLTTQGTNINSLADAFTMLSGAEPGNPFTYWTDKTSTAYMAAGDGIPRSVRQFLGGVEGSILDTYGGEYEWDKFTVRLWNARGNLLDFTIRYGLNLLDYTEDTDYSETFTAVVPYWTGQDSSGATEILLGDRVDSGLTSYNGRNDCVPLDMTDKFETKPSKAALETAARTLIQAKAVNLPHQSIKVDFVRLQDMGEFDQFANLMHCRLCDSVSVVFPAYGMQGVFKVVKVEYDTIEERYRSVELGSLSTSLSEALGISNGLPTILSGGGGGTVDDLVVNNTLAVGGDSDFAGDVGIAGDLTVSGFITAEGHSSAIGSTLSGTKDTTVTTLTTTVKTIATIALPAGTWQVKGWIRFPAGTSGYRRLWVTSSSTLTSTASSSCVQVTSSTQTNLMNTVVATPSGSGTTNYYLRAQSSVSLTVSASDDWSLTAVRIS